MSTLAGFIILGIIIGIGVLGNYALSEDKQKHHPQHQ
jgi:hypothetical protein